MIIDVIFAVCVLYIGISIYKHGYIKLDININHVYNTPQPVNDDNDRMAVEERNKEVENYQGIVEALNEFIYTNKE